MIAVRLPRQNSITPHIFSQHIVILIIIGDESGVLVFEKPEPFVPPAVRNVCLFYIVGEQNMTNGDSNLTQPFGLMDGASGEFQQIHQEVNRQREITADHSRPLAERLEACEDIIDSEVGDTAFIFAHNIEREPGLARSF